LLTITVPATVLRPYTNSLYTFHSYHNDCNARANASSISSIPSVPGLSDTSTRTVSTAESSVDGPSLDQSGLQRSRIKRRQRLRAYSSQRSPSRKRSSSAFLDLGDNCHSNFQAGDATAPKTCTNSTDHHIKHTFTLTPVRGRGRRLTEQQRKDAALMRQLGACTNCRRRKSKVCIIAMSLIFDTDMYTVQSGAPCACR
jgi:hypothetical protein